MKKLVTRIQEEVYWYDTCDEMLKDIQERQKLEDFSRVKEFNENGSWYVRFEKDLSRQDTVISHLEELNNLLDEVKRVANTWTGEKK